MQMGEESPFHRGRGGVSWCALLLSMMYIVTRISHHVGYVGLTGGTTMFREPGISVGLL